MSNAKSVAGEVQPSAVLPDDVVRLVIAARGVAYYGPAADTMQELDQAAEAFAVRVPWDDEPDAEGSEPEVVGEATPSLAGSGSAPSTLAPSESRS
jgi:hypothetical protein